MNYDNNRYRSTKRNWNFRSYPPQNQFRMFPNDSRSQSFRRPLPEVGSRVKYYMVLSAYENGLPAGAVVARTATVTAVEPGGKLSLHVLCPTYNFHATGVACGYTERHWSY